MFIAEPANCVPSIDARPDTASNTSQDCPGKSGQSFFYIGHILRPAGLAG